MKRDLIAQIYAKYHRQLFLYIYAICGNYAMTEDIVQETFTKAILSLDDSHDNFIAWLYMVGRNLCFNEMKRRGRISLPGEIPETASDTDILAEFIGAEENGRLYNAMLQLPVRARQIIVMQYFSGLPHSRIAQVLGITTGNVKVIAHRAKRELREKLEDRDE
jgi:RNA polymerase sigma-70 factor (ECF subfamily)